MLNKKRLIAFVWVCTELNGRRDKGPPNFIPNRFGRTDGHIGTETNFKLLWGAAVRNLGQWAKA